ncbi:MAG: hypothetical protein AB4062_12455 [Crocosphaera sp.]
MTQQTNLEITIAIEDSELDDEALQEVTQNLLEQIDEIVEMADLVAIDQAPKGSKAFGGFMLGLLTASVKPANLLKLGLFLKDRLGDTQLKIELESPDGRKFKGEASSREEMDYLFQKAQEWQKNG